MSQKQELARYRNFLKFRLMGMHMPNDSKKLTLLEKHRIKEIEIRLKLILSDFDRNSRTLGLNIPEYRCYFSPCRCKIKYKGTIEGECMWFCKKHFNEYLDIYGLDSV